MIATFSWNGIQTILKQQNCEFLIEFKKKKRIPKMAIEKLYVQQ